MNKENCALKLADEIILYINMSLLQLECVDILLGGVRRRFQLAIHHSRGSVVM